MRYFRRFIWFFATRLLAVTLAVGLLVMGFYLAMNASHMYVILKDGMAKRAQTIMMAAPEDDLQDYFTAAFLESDAALRTARAGGSPYQQYYTITGFDHRIKMDSVWCWPWDLTAAVVMEEQIPAIDGKINNAGREAMSAQQLGSAPPPWTSGRYRVTMVQENGHWKVSSMALIGSVP